MGQAASDLFSMADGLDALDHDGGPNIDSKLLHTRQQLLTAIQMKEDCTHVLNELMSLDCPNIMKYSSVNMQDLLLANNQNLEQLKSIPIGLNILEKYGRHLIKPKDSRNELWRYVKYANPIFKDRVQPLKGSMDIMYQMGYTSCVDDGLYFPREREPDIRKTMNIIADIILAKHEMEAYINGIHPKPDEITKFLSPQAIEEVQRLQRGSPTGSPTESSTRQSEELNKYPIGGVALPGMVNSAIAVSGTPTANTSQSSSNHKSKACDICAENASTLCCGVCDNKHLCADCDEVWHKHPKRQAHKRTPVMQDQSLEVQTNAINVQGPYGIRALPSVSVKRTAAMYDSNLSLKNSENSGSSVDHSTAATTPASNLPKFDSLVLKSTELNSDPDNEPMNSSVTYANLQIDLQNKSNRSSGQKPEIPDRRLKPALTQTQSQRTYQSVYLPPQVPFLNSNSNAQPSGPSANYVQPATNPSGTTHTQPSWPSANYVQPSANYVQPSANYVQPSANYVQPSANYVQPSANYVQSATNSSGTTHIQPSLESFSTSDLYANQGYYQQSSNNMNNLVAKTNTEDLSASGAAQQQLQSGFHRPSSVGAQSVQLSTNSFQRTNSAAASGCSTSKLLAKIMAVPDLEKRRAKCEINILTLQEEMEEIEDNLTRIVEENENFHESSEFNTQTRKKGMLLREKKTLEKYKAEMDMTVAGAVIQATEPQDVFYPPSVISMSSSTSVTATSPLQSVPRSSASTTVMSSEMLYRTSESAHPETMYFSSVGLQSPTSPLTLPSSAHNQMPHQQVRVPGSDSSAHNNQQMRVPGSDSSAQNNQQMPHQQERVPGSEDSDVAKQLQLARDQHLFHQQNMPTLRAQLSSMFPTSSAAVPTTTATSQSRNQRLSASSPTFPPSMPSAMSGAMSSPMSSGIPGGTTGIAGFQGPVSGISEQYSRISDVSSSKVKQPAYEMSGIAQSTKQSSQCSVPPSGAASNVPTATVSVPQVAAMRKSSTGFQQKWHCEHCTMINEPGTRVCQVCNKTSDVPTFISEPEQGATEQGAVEQGATSSELNDTDETHVIKIGRKIGEIHDQIYHEKQEAKQRYEELLRKEAVENKSYGCKADKLPVKSSLYPQLPPLITEQQQNSSVVTTELNASNSSLGSSSSGSVNPRLSSFEEKIQAINEERHVKQMCLDGADLVQLFKSCQRAGYEFDVVEVALERCDSKLPFVLEWLNKNWGQMIHTVINLVKQEGNKLEQNDVGEISEEEAVSMLKETKGEVEAAVKRCIKARKDLYAEINADKIYPREEVLDAMFQENGKKEEVLVHLDMNRLQPFVDRVWNGALLYTDITQIAMGDTLNSVATSVINHKEFQDKVKDQTTDMQRRIRMILVEARLKSWGRAEIVLKILDYDLKHMDQGYECTLEDIVEAVRNCADRKSAIFYLQKECQLCYSKFPMSKMRNLNFCQCQMCVECFIQNFALTIREKNVRNWSCPICDQPDLEDENASDYLSFLCLLLKTLVDQDTNDLFETKIRDWHLQKDPNFRWCAHCGNGFLYQGWQNGRGRLDMTCPHCKKKTCFDCKKQWVDQHTGLTCKEYEQWTIDNDPKNQALGLAKHLEESGIDCPSCKMRYSLAKGGCMHFKCPQCAFDFCSGCNKPFHKIGTCKKFKSCKKQGFHCHHPRDCFFYLRDNTIEELQDLLKQGSVDFNTVMPAGQQDREHCPVMEQKEAAQGHKDEPCGRDVPENHAGLCENHYKEYLVGLINNNKLDPLLIMSVEEMDILLDRMEIHKNKPKKNNEPDNTFRDRFREFVGQNVPLERH